MIKNCFVISLTSLTLLTACVDNTAVKDSSGKGFKVTPTPTSTPAPSSPTPVTSSAAYPLQANSPSFEEDLNQAMGQSDRIEVKLPKAVEPETEGLQPAVLAEVMAAVEKSGGKVDYEPIKTEMAFGLVPILVSITASLISNWLRSSDAQASTAPPNRFPQASRFDVRMCFREQDNKVTKMMLVPRGEEKKGACTN